MSNNTEQKITSKDLQAFIVESNRHKKWKNVYKLAQIILTPLIITIVSMLVTVRINEQQARNTKAITDEQRKNAETIANANRESSEIIAKANRENSRKISESDQRIERLKHINDIFQNFLIEEKENFNDPKVEAQVMQIKSLEVYKEDALPFLINIKDYYQDRKKKEKGDSKQKTDYNILATQAFKSISNILGKSQIDFSGRFFMDCTGPIASSDDSDLLSSCQSFIKYFREHKAELFTPSTAKQPGGEADITAKQTKGQSGNPFMTRYNKLQTIEVNMRQQEYKNYNFSDCSFLSVNLYKADFSSSTMKNNLFIRVDLQETSFSGSNLSGSIFWKSNLQKADFLDSRLRDVVFVNPIMNKRIAKKAVTDFCEENSCCELEGARFLLGSLLWTSSPPFDIFDMDNAKNGGIGEELKKERRQLYLNLLMHHLQSISNIIEAAKKGDEKQKKDLDSLIKNTGSESEDDLIIRLEEAAEKAKILATPSTAHKKPLVSKR